MTKQQIIDDQDRQIKQLSLNDRWLIGKIDAICYALSPNFVGTWQQRAEEALRAAKEIEKKRNKEKS